MPLTGGMLLDERVIFRICASFSSIKLIPATGSETSAPIPYSTHLRLSSVRLKCEFPRKEGSLRFHLETDPVLKKHKVIIRQFAPYYNESSSAELAADGLTETRVLISTDVLSEGLNLQHATRLINYDLHWNPVRLMQRIGRIDRRMSPQTEQRIVADHPDQKEIRGIAVYLSNMN